MIGAGSIGQAIARRVSAGKHVLLGDLRGDNAKAAALVLSNAGFDVSTATIDVSSRQSVRALVEAATAIGSVTGLIHAAGVSPATILAVDLYGTALVLEEFGNVIENAAPAWSLRRNPATASALSRPSKARLSRRRQLTSCWPSRCFS